VNELPKQIKASYTQEVGRSKQKLFADAFKRVDRAISSGFHLEAIVILESLICDRLETSISVKTQISIEPGTLASLNSKCKKLEILTQDLYDQVDTWRMHRNLVMHQMVKITSAEDADWRARMSFARQVARDGKQLLNKVQKNLYVLQSSNEGNALDP
jgi:hypothetical protein